MNVCFISAEYPPLVGGVGDYTRHLAGGLTRLGSRVTVMTGTGASAEHQGPAELEWQTRVVQATSSWGWKSLGKIEAELAAANPDVIHIQYQTLAYGMHPAICMLPRWLRWRGHHTPVVTTFHDVMEPYLFPKAGPLRRWVTSSFAGSSDGVVATNGADAATLEAWLAGARSTRRASSIEVIPIGSNIGPPRPDGTEPAWARQQLGITNDTAIIGFYGFVNPSKGIDTLIRAFDILRSGGSDAHLVFFGAPAPGGPAGQTSEYTVAAARTQVAAAGLESHVTWRGYQSPATVSRWLHALDCCVLPFSDGASPRHGTLLTALAHGAATVTTRPRQAPIDGPLPWLRDGEQCLQVDARNPRQLASAIATVLAGGALRLRLVESARRWAAQFDWDTIAGQTLSHYVRTLARARSGFALQVQP
ncbi:MAG: glycosyltransferase family 4 protein [Chloroflexota bacterium]